jgi:hypothetical protein
MLLNWTTLAERNIRNAPLRFCANTPPATEAATNNKPTMVAEAVPGSA